MVTFCLLVAPLPYAIRKKLFSFLSESFIVAKIAYALKISFMSVPFIATLLRTLTSPISFVAILFVDALQRMLRVTAESDLAKSSQQDVRTETGLAARKF
jgi:B-cell receptor-associated protein 31